MAGNKKRVWLGCGGGVLIGVPALWFLGWFLLFRTSVLSDADQVPDLLRQARALGIPLTSAELMPNPPIPESENAARVYEQAFKAYDELTKRQSDGLDEIRNLGLPQQKPEHKAAAYAALQAAGPVVALLAKATAMDKCCFATDYSKGFDLLYPDFSKMKRCEDLLTGLARMQVDTGDVADAFVSLSRAARMSRHVGQVPSVDAALTAHTMEIMCLRPMKKILAQRSRDPIAIRGIQPVIDALGPLPPFRRDIVGDVSATLTVIRRIHDWPDVTKVPDLLPGPPLSTFQKYLISNPSFGRAVESKYLKTVIAMVQRFPTDPKDWRGYAVSMARTENELQIDKSLTGRFVQMIWPSPAELPKYVAALHADKNLVAVSARLLAIRASGRPLPDVLPDFGPISIDPMDGQRLKYRRIGRGFRLYALRFDMSDHGGGPRLSGSPYFNDNMVEFK